MFTKQRAALERISKPTTTNLNLPFVFTFSPALQSRRTVLDRFCRFSSFFLTTSRERCSLQSTESYALKTWKGSRNKARQRGALGMLNLFFLEPKRLARIQFLTDIKRHFGQVTFWRGSSPHYQMTARDRPFRFNKLSHFKWDQNILNIF